MKVPISKVVIERINWNLAANDQILKARRSRMQVKRYYILDLSGNVVDADIDPEALARKLGVLKEGEEEREKNQGRKARPER
jgi:hypothetical protein